MSQTLQARCIASAILAVAILALTFPSAAAADDGGVTFTDVAVDSGIVYEQTPPARFPLRREALDMLPVLPDFFLSDVRPTSPMKPRGNPGVAILDYDGDGDLDIYATNGPGSANSLFSNQLRETGTFAFADLAIAAGVDATNQESAGVCFGDIDNDGDEDLYVVATGGHDNLMFENRGDGTFTDITDIAGVDGYGRETPSCTFGDANNDGLLDLFVSATYDDWRQRFPIYHVGPHYPFFEHNILYMNQGDNTFVDATAAAGLDHPSNMTQPGASGAAHTWISAFVDMDGDGDVDILSADNQGAAASGPEEERGYLRLYINDGSGSFQEVTQTVGLDQVGGWMGLSFGDVNCDGTMDFFGTNLGDYITFGNSDLRSTIWVQNADGTYTNAGPDQANPFGWGTSMFDYDNDGDTDILYHGGIDILQIIDISNPGVLLQNQGNCSGDFEYDMSAFTTDHRYRNIHGVATGDLNEDGFTDVVTVANHLIPLDHPAQIPMTVLTGGPLGSPFDDIAYFALTVSSGTGMSLEVDPELVLPNGNMTVELNGGNSNNWVGVSLHGNAGRLRNGHVNRDGIGAVVSFTPKGGATVKQPVLGGASYSSQNSTHLNFGLGAANMGDLEILWPGGVRNKLMNVKAGEEILFPEIPCSYDGPWEKSKHYRDCVRRSLVEMAQDGIISWQDRSRFLASAMAAYEGSR